MRRDGIVRVGASCRRLIVVGLVIATCQLPTQFADASRAGRDTVTVFPTIPTTYASKFNDLQLTILAAGGDNYADLRLAKRAKELYGSDLNSSISVYLVAHSRKDQVRSAVLVLSGTSDSPTIPARLLAAVGANLLFDSLSPDFLDAFQSGVLPNLDQLNGSETKLPVGKFADLHVIVAQSGARSRLFFVYTPKGAAVPKAINRLPKRVTSEQAVKAEREAAAAAAAAAAADAAAKDSIDSDGLYEIGVDKNPGRYKTQGGTGCYYAILNSPDTSDIATNNLTDGPGIVDLPAGKFFETRSCGTWTRTG